MFLSCLRYLFYYTIEKGGGKAMLGRTSHSMSASIGLYGIMVVIFLEVAYV